MSERTEAFADRLARKVPSLTDIWDDHRQHFGQQAPQAFIRTIAQIAPSRYVAGVGPAGELQAIFAFLEAEFDRDEELDSIIAESFLVHLPRGSDPRVTALDLLGPKLRAELERQWRGEGLPVRDPGKDLMHQLAEAEPTIQPALHEHVDYYDEMLEHVFLGEVTATIVEWVESGEPAALARARTVIDTLETAYGTNFEVDELIAASFVENLPYPDEPGGEIAEILPPRLKAELLRQREGQDDIGAS